MAWICRIVKRFPRIVAKADLEKWSRGGYQRSRTLSLISTPIGLSEEVL